MTRSPQPVRAADLAFLKTLACLGPGPRDPTQLLDLLSTSWNRRLQGAELARLPAQEADRELDRLRQDLQAERHPDPRRVHPSWWLRALQAESPSIRQAVYPTLPSHLRSQIPPSLAQQPASSRPPDPGVLAWVLSLWAERLVGGPEPSEHDPPAIRLLTTGSRFNLARHLHRVAIAKYAFVRASMPERSPDLSLDLRPAPNRFFLQLRARLQGIEVDRRLLQAGIRDLQASHEGGPARLSALTRLGAFSLARLLAFAEPYRVRWALQHLPYEFAKHLRGLMNLRSPDLTPRQLFQWEESLWKIASELSETLREDDRS